MPRIHQFKVRLKVKNENNFLIELNVEIVEW